ncbi:MAG TPA: hypothetical protein VGP99_05085 [Tepidisphaeraceae bacterium]|nr:hypothetical protein [Tepidisphaeraceae bacterium]
MKFMVCILAGTLAIGLLAWKVSLPRSIPVTVPALEQQWDQQVYGLDDNEVIRFFFPALKVRRGRTVDPPIGFAPPEETHCVYEVGPRATDSTGQSGGPDSVRSAINWCARLDELDFEVPEDIPGLPAYGDWLIRGGAPTARMIPALQSLLSAIGGREFVNECALGDREVIVVSGKWNFSEPAGPHRYFSYTAKTRVASQYRGSERDIWSGSLDDSFRFLEERIHIKIINEVDQPYPREVRWFGNGYPYSRDVDAFLSTLQQQTSLTFTRTHREIPIWFLLEKSPTTQPVAAK